MKTKIAIACDDLGFETKEAIKKYLIEEKMLMLSMIQYRYQRMESILLLS